MVSGAHAAVVVEDRLGGLGVGLGDALSRVGAVGDALEALRDRLTEAGVAADDRTGGTLAAGELVERSGLERTRVMAIYLGRWTPSPAERDRLAGVLGVSKDEITWGHKTPIQHIYGLGPM